MLSYIISHTNETLVKIIWTHIASMRVREMKRQMELDGLQCIWRHTAI